MSVVLGDVIPPSGDCPENLWKAFEEFSAEHASSVAIVTEDRMITYQELAEWVDSIAVWIRDEGGGHSKQQGEAEANRVTKQSAKDKTASGKSYSRKNSGAKLNSVKSSSDIKQSSAKTTICHNKRKLADTVIAICLARCPEIVPLILAIWKVGSHFVPLDSNLPLLRTSQVLKGCNPSIIVGSTETMQKLKKVIATNNKSIERRSSDTKKKNPVSDRTLDNEDDINNKSEIVPAVVLNIDDCKSQIHPNKNDSSSSKICLQKDDAENKPLRSTLEHHSEKYNFNDRRPSKELYCKKKTACIVYTSGTMARPKGVKLTHRNLFNRINWQLAALPFGRNEVCMITKPFTSIDAIIEIFVPLLGGTPVVIIRQNLSNPEVFIKTIVQFGVTRLLLLPTYLRQLLNHIKSSSSRALLGKSIKLWSVSGQQISAKLLTEFYDIFPNSKLINLYGSAETSGNITCYGVSERCLLVNGKVPVGSPIYNNGILVIGQRDDEAIVLEEGQLGEIVCLGLNVHEGYVTSNSGNDVNSLSFLPLKSIYFSNRLSMENVIDFCQEIDNFEMASRKDSSASDVSVKVEANVFDEIFINKKLHERVIDHLNVNISYLRSTPGRRRSSGSLLLMPTGNLRSRSSSMCSSLLTAASPSTILSNTSRRSSMPPSLSGSPAGSYTNKRSASNTSLRYERRLSSTFSSRTGSPVFISVSERNSPTSANEKQRSRPTTRNFDRCRSIPIIVCDPSPVNDGTSQNRRMTPSMSEHNVGEFRRAASSSVSSDITDNKTSPATKAFMAADKIANPSSAYSRIARRGSSETDILKQEKLQNRDRPHFQYSAVDINVRMDVRNRLDLPLAKIENTSCKVYKTGDIGRIVGGVLILEGRIDSRVQIRGTLIDTEEIEEAISSTT